MIKNTKIISCLGFLGATLLPLCMLHAAETTATPPPVSPQAASPPALLPPPPPTAPAAPPEDPNNPPSRTYEQNQNAAPYVPAPYVNTPPPEDEPQYYRRGRRRRYNSGPSVQSTTTLLNFRFAGIGAYQSGVSVYSLMASWNPQITLKGGQYLGLNLGATGLTNALNQNTPVLEYQVTVGLPIVSPMGIEFGLGFQSWFNNGETDPLLSANLFFKIPNFFVDRIFVGYSAYLMNYFYTSEVKLGVGFSF